MIDKPLNPLSLKLFEINRLPKAGKVRHRFRKESLTYNDRQITEPIKSQIV
ncbi:hypothetical protein [Cocleimonas sp. KMM 6896]|uniref:hypothetical protein n=1 Tax=Cocleimonas sp. KMM 6896 TaxID=2993580 RepID=UPI002DD6B88C|nr:hypothetical protein [Cocleimonas sp. KMM 6896]MEC4743767.1 hypothetical protein [Cocleimonas sp. KMM 6896]